MTAIKIITYILAIVAAIAALLLTLPTTIKQINGTSEKQLFKILRLTVYGVCFVGGMLLIYTSFFSGMMLVILWKMQVIWYYLKDPEPATEEEKARLKRFELLTIPIFLVLLLTAIS